MKWQENVAALLRQSDPQQLHRFGNIVRFFAVLLVITLIARGTAGATMPVVTLQAPSSGTVSRNVMMNGTISYAGGTPFTLPSGLLVTSVPVQVGQTVKAGDTLATFDEEELKRAVASKQAELQQVEVQAAQQAEGDSADPYSAQLAQEQLERAYAETQKTYEEGMESVERMRLKRNEAAQDLENARNAPLDDTLPKSEAEAQKQANIDAATADLEAAEEALYQAEKAAEDANDAALSAAQSVEDSRNTALHALEKEEESVADQNELNRAAAAVSDANATELQAELDVLQALLKEGARYTAPQNGTVIQLNLKVGENSPKVGGLIADEVADYTLSIPLDKDQAQQITVGTVLHVNQSKVSGDAAVQNLSETNAEGTVTATATLPQGCWNAGACNVSATSQSSRQDFVLPSTAIRQDGDGFFVLAAEEQNTILGLQNVLVRLPVTVLEEGDTTTAVSGALDYDTQVVVFSDKSVQAGDKVRIRDNT